MVFPSIRCVGNTKFQNWLNDDHDALFGFGSFHICSHGICTVFAPVDPDDHGQQPLGWAVPWGDCPCLVRSAGEVLSILVRRGFVAFSGSGTSRPQCYSVQPGSTVLDRWQYDMVVYARLAKVGRTSVGILARRRGEAAEAFGSKGS